VRVHHHVTTLLGVLYLAAATGWGQDRITEGDVIRTLNGKPYAAAPGQPLGVTLHVTFSPQANRAAKGSLAVTGASSQPDEALYKPLIPLARVLEAEVFSKTRFVIRVMPNSPLPGKHASELGQQLADRITHFLTTYFAISRERLSLEVPQTPSTAETLGVPAQGPQRWRLEVFRQE
jgi:hypothetical protein